MGHALTFDAAGPELASIDLGPAADEDMGALSHTGGNLYVYVDGHEVGSLWFHRDNGGNLLVTWGAFSEETQGWEFADENAESNAITNLPGTLVVLAENLK